jgi:predicted SAM-dependent methyltransferase
VLAEIRRILKPNGVVALAYPMELNYLVPRLRALLRLQKQSPNKPYHLYYYTTKTLAELLNQCQFEVKKEKVNKIIHRKPILIHAMDSLNYVLTMLTGKCGDRGFTIAQPLCQEESG